jgi:hypothetical protein
MTKSIHSTSKDTNELSITVYNGLFGVVKEKRSLHLTPDTDHVLFMDVAAKIETDSLMIKGVQVHELNYDYDLVNKAKLFEKYLDKIVYLKDGQGARKECRLLSVHGGIMLEDVETKELLIDPADEIILPKLPEGLIVKPALVWKIPPQETSAIEVSYITGGLAWTANYVIELSGTLCHLDGWVEILNQSGTAFTDASLKLIAGEVKRVKGGFIEPDQTVYDMQVVYSSSEPSFSEQEFADYHMYKLNRKVTMKNEQTKQIQFFQAQNVPCTIYYECHTSGNKAKTYIEFHNRADQNLGIPFPKGTVKVYQRDGSDDALEFIGEDEIDHTPRNEKIRLALGEAFDLVCEHEEKNKVKRKGRTVEKHEVILKNRKSSAAAIRLNHYVYPRHWEITASTHPYERESSKNLLFNVEVPADSEVTVKFEIEIDETVHVKVDR